VPVGCVIISFKEIYLPKRRDSDTSVFAVIQAGDMVPNACVTDPSVRAAPLWKKKKNHSQKAVG